MFMCGILVIETCLFREVSIIPVMRNSMQIWFILFSGKVVFLGFKSMNLPKKLYWSGMGGGGMGDLCKEAFHNGCKKGMLFSV